MLGLRQRQWANIKPSFVQRLVFPRRLYVIFIHRLEI